MKIDVIYNEDCIGERGMRILPDKSIDMILCDLPYGTTACKWDKIIPLEPMWEQLKRIIKPNGVIALTASQPFTTTLISSNMKMFKYEWIWNKVGGSNFLNLKNRPLKTQEQILIFSKTANFTFNPIRIPRTKKSLKRSKAGTTSYRDVSLPIEHYGIKSTKGLKFATDGMKHPIDIIKFSVHEKGRYKIKHPTKKPLALMEYLIKTYTNEGETILDFAFGSGTTLVACVKLNRHYIGFETNPKDCEIAKKRLSEIQLELIK